MSDVDDIEEVDMDDSVDITLSPMWESVAQGRLRGTHTIVHPDFDGEILQRIDHYLQLHFLNYMFSMC